MMELSDVTVVIMSRGRENELRKTLEFWAEVEVRVLVLHNTQKPLPLIESMPNLKYVVAEVPYGERCGLVTEYLQTKYAILCSDDEVYVPSALNKMKSILDVNPELDSVGGLTIAIGKYGPITTGNFTYRKMRNYSNRERTPGHRLDFHFREGDSYRNGAIYRLMRKELMIDTMNLFSKVSTFSTPYIYEVSGELFVNSRGQCVYIDEIYWLRNWINDPVGHKNWDRNLYFKDWCSLINYREQYKQWVSIIEDSCKINSKDFKSILARVTRLRTESELHEISVNKRFRIALPQNVKWFIRTCFRPSSLPKSLTESLNMLDEAGIAVDKAAIGRALSALS